MGVLKCNVFGILSPDPLLSAATNRHDTDDTLLRIDTPPSSALTGQHKRIPKCTMENHRRCVESLHAPQTAKTGTPNPHKPTSSFVEINRDALPARRRGLHAFACAPGSRDLGFLRIVHDRRALRYFA